MTELQTMPLRFRVWDKEDKKFVRSVTISGPQNWPCRFNLISGYFEMGSDDRFIISQDTGLVDKNGKHIFTGDLVKSWDEYIGQVYYDEVLLQMRVKFDDGDDEDLASCEAEVIGNIWGNPELLEVKEAR